MICYIEQVCTNPEHQFPMVTKFYMVTPKNLWILNVELGFCHSSGIYNFKALPTLMGDLCTYDIEPALISFRFKYRLWFDGSSLFTLLPIYIYIYIYIPLWRCGQTLAMVSSLLRFLDQTQRRITVGRTPLEVWSARRRDLYLTTHNSHNKHPCPRWDSNSRSQQASGRRQTP